MTHALDDEVDGNFDAFQAMLPNVINVHRGKFALMRNREIKGYYSTLRGALEAGQQFADRLFSIQEVTDRPADLGLFSHAVNTRFT